MSGCQRDADRRLTRGACDRKEVTGAPLLVKKSGKQPFILTLNIASLKTGGTVADLWLKNNALARSVAHEIIELQEWTVKVELPHERLIADLEKVIRAN